MSVNDKDSSQTKNKVGVTSMADRIAMFNKKKEEENDIVTKDKSHSVNIKIGSINSRINSISNKSNEIIKNKEVDSNIKIEGNVNAILDKFKNNIKDNGQATHHKSVFINSTNKNNIAETLSKIQNNNKETSFERDNVTNPVNTLLDNKFVQAINKTKETNEETKKDSNLNMQHKDNNLEDIQEKENENEIENSDKKPKEKKIGYLSEKFKLGMAQRLMQHPRFGVKISKEDENSEVNSRKEDEAERESTKETDFRSRCYSENSNNFIKRIDNSDLNAFKPNAINKKKPKRPLLPILEELLNEETIELVKSQSNVNDNKLG